MEPSRATFRLDVPPLHLEPKKTLADSIEGHSRIYFFSEEGFQYRDQVHRYFDGEDTLAATDGEEFLKVLSVVLDQTEYVQCSDSLSADEDSIEWIVRERFLELYQENDAMLRQIQSPVHDKVESLEWSDDDPFESIDFASQVLNFINGDEPQDSVAKYYDRLEGSITEKESGEFMRVYEVVKRTCPLVNATDSSSDSRCTMVRERFDELYFAQEQDFIGWGKVFFSPLSSFESPYRPGNGESLSPGAPKFCFELVEEEGPLKFEDYDFVAAGLGDFKEQIIGFYNGTMPNKEGLFEVLQAVFSCYPPETPKDSFEGKLREKFSGLFLTECAEKPCVLTPSQKDLLWKLSKTGSSQNSYLNVPPRERVRDQGEVSGGGSSGDIPPWQQGLAAIGAIILSWVIFKPIFYKLSTFIKEKYGPRTNHPS